MVIVRIVFSAKPDESANLEQTARECVELARQTPKCLAYEFLRVLNEPDTYVLYEEWENQKDFEIYKASPVFKKVGEKLTPLLASTPDTCYFTAEKVEI